MKKLVSMVLSLAMLFSLGVPAYAADEQGNDRIRRSDIENLFETKASDATVNSVSTDDEEAVFLNTIDEIQKLYFKQEAAIEAGESTEMIDAEIARLENSINQLPHAVHLTAENVPTTRGIKPTLPSSNSYVNVYAYDKVGTYNGTQYDVFEIYCSSKKAGGFANPIGYEGDVTLVTDSKWDQNEYMQKEIYAVAKFVAGSIYAAFGIADFLVLSQMPDFFDDGSTQKVTAEYRLGQTFLFAYAAEKGVNWYDHVLTTEQLSHSDTIIAASTNNGITEHQSKSNNRVVRATYYPTSSTSKTAANQAAKIYATMGVREAYYVGSVSYYVDNVKKATINTNSYGELYAIPGL